MQSQLFKKAYEKYATGDYPEALRLIKECRKKLRKKAYLYKNDKNLATEEVDLRLFEGKIHQQLDDIEAAENIFKDLKQKLVAVDYVAKTQGKLSYHLSEVAERKGNREEQVKWLWQSKDEFVEGGDFEMAVDVMFDLADTEEFPSQSGLVEHYKDIIELTKNIADSDISRLNAARARLEVGYLLRNGDPKVASRFLILAHKEFDRLQQSPLKYRSLIQLADLRSITNLNRSKEILSKALPDIEPDNEFYHIIVLKLINYRLRDDEYDKAQELYEKINDSIEDTQPSLFLANALLETAKAYLLLPYTDESFEIASNLANRSVEFYDSLDLKIGKAIGYLIEGISQYFLYQNSADNSKLQLVHFLAKKLEDKSTFKVDKWVRDMVRYLANSDIESDEIIAKLRVSEDIPTMTQNAEILHLLGLYKLSNTDMETARSYLDSSKSLYNKTGNYSSVTKQIEKQLADVAQ